MELNIPLDDCSGLSYDIDASMKERKKGLQSDFMRRILDHFMFHVGHVEGQRKSHSSPDQGWQKRLGHTDFSSQQAPAVHQYAA